MDIGRQTVLQMKFARIIGAMAEQGGMSVEDAMDAFYNSQTMQLIEDGVADLHCRSDKYLAEEVLLELGLHQADAL